MAEPSSKVNRLLTASLAVLALTAALAAIAVGCMRLEDFALGALYQIALSLCLTLFCAIGAICRRGKFRAFCLAAIVPLASSVRTATTTLTILLDKLSPQWPPVFVDVNEQAMRDATESLGLAILGSLALGHVALAAVWLVDKLRQAGVRPRLQFGLKSIFLSTTVVGFLFSAAVQIRPANQTQALVIACCAGAVPAVALALYVAALLVPPIKLKTSARRPDETNLRSR